VPVAVTDGSTVRVASTLAVEDTEATAVLESSAETVAIENVGCAEGVI
jgi:hypothetical protein